MKMIPLVLLTPLGGVVGGVLFPYLIKHQIPIWLAIVLTFSMAGLIGFGGTSLMLYMMRRRD